MAFFPAASAAQETDNDAILRDLVKHDVRKAMGVSLGPDGRPLPAQFVMVHRREDLEERLASLQLPPSGEGHIGQQVKEIRIYEALDTGYEVSDGKVVGERFEVDGNGGVGWLVAVDPSKGETFDLWRFEDSAQNFNRLISRLGVMIHDRLNAQFVLSDYFVLANGLREFSDEIVGNEVDLRIDALRYFRSAKPKTAYDDFVRWWGMLSPELKRDIRWPDATRLNDGFSIVLFRFSDGRLFKEQWKVSMTGAVTHLSFESLCCRTKSKADKN